MRNAVRFKSSAFNSSEPKDYFINPCCFGDDLGRWLGPHLEALGYQVSGLDQEDWGWYLDSTKGNITHTLNIGYVADEDRNWQIFLERYRSLADRLFGRNTSIDSQFAEALHNVLASAAEIEDIEWLYVDSRGRESDLDKRPL